MIILLNGMLHEECGVTILNTAKAEAKETDTTRDQKRMQTFARSSLTKFPFVLLENATLTVGRQVNVCMCRYEMYVK